MTLSELHDSVVREFWQRITEEYLGCPSSHEKLADAAQASGNYREAAIQWWFARTASLGHNRRARYDEAALQCINTLHKEMSND